MSRLHYTRTFYPYSRNVCIFIHTLNVSLFFLLQVLVFFFFFFQAEDGIRDGGRDWSSDVCSSDLDPLQVQGRAASTRIEPADSGLSPSAAHPHPRAPAIGETQGGHRCQPRKLHRCRLCCLAEIGRASCRERV